MAGLASGARRAWTIPVAGAISLGLAAALAAPAAALPPKHSQGFCGCACDTGPNGVHQMSYQAMASCGVYNGKTCNVEVSPGVIPSGTLKNCGLDHRWVDAAAASKATTKLSSDPSKAQPPRVKVTPAGKAAVAQPK